MWCPESRTKQTKIVGLVQWSLTIQHQLLLHMGNYEKQKLTQCTGAPCLCSFTFKLKQGKELRKVSFTTM